MKFRVELLGLFVLGCNAATPVPDWTPPRAQVRPERESSKQQLAEAESRSLPVTASPSPPKRQALILGQVPTPSAQRALVPQSEPSSSYPRYQPRPTIPEAVPLDQPAAAQAGVDFAAVNIDQFLGLGSSSSCAVVLLVDVSGSVFQQGVEVAVDAAAKVYARQAPNDRIWVIAFGSQPEMVVNGHGRLISREQLGRALIGSRPAQSGTFLAPAIQMAASALGRSTQARRVVVVSDGVLGDPELALWQAGHAWKEREISFSTVHIGERSGADILQEIAAQTGGHFISSR